MPKRNNLRSLELKRFSAVGRPAQEGATARLIKSADPADAPESDSEKVEKNADLLTGETRGHQHGVMIRECHCSYPEDCPHEYTIHVEHTEPFWHSHPIAKGSDGVWQIGMTNAHTHDLDSELLQQRIDEKMSMSKGEPMSEKTEAQKALEDQVAQLQKIVALSGDERAHYDGLNGDAQTAFLDKSRDERAELIKTAEVAAAEADPVVYTTKGGVALRKSDGDVAVALAKETDALYARNETLEKANEQARLEKRYNGEFANLPNENGAALALIKAAESIPGAEQVLKAAHEANANLFKTAGVSGEPPLPAGEEFSDPGVAFEKKAEELAKSENIPHHEAVVKFGRTPEGQALRAREELNKRRVQAATSSDGISV